MDRKARAKLNTQIYEEACEWFIECRGGDLDVTARAEFDRWLRKSPEHLSAYLEIAAIWHEGPALDPRNKWDTDTLVAQAAEDRGNVVPIAVPPPAPPREVPDPEALDRRAAETEQRPDPEAGNRRATGTAQRSSARQGEPWAASVRAAQSTRRWVLAASIAAITVTGAAVLWSSLLRGTSYATAIGEQRSIALSDGSTVELNSRSRIRIRYTEQERTVELLEGQALFIVAPDAARPFTVASDTTRIRAVGTQFDVYKKRTGVIVTVVEGRVAIAGASSSAEPKPTLLSAGEQLTVTPDTIRKADKPNIESATAWRQRQLIFKSASLIEVAEEFNRYNERRLSVDDPTLYDFHISGVFSSTDPASLIRFLRTRSGVRVTETASEIRIEKNSSSKE
jgi:transmembrane sensor